VPRLPYGYIPGGRDRTGQRLADIDPEAVTIVRRIFRRIRAGDSYGEIARSLNSDGINAPQGGREWTPMTVRRIAANDVYLGRERRKALIGQAVWDAAQDALEERAAD
jgi:site-specific DNA recombinase